MKLMMTFLYTMLFFLFGNSKEVFFENINVGDNLETCLANGYVQYKRNSSSLELANGNVAMNYFTFSEVKFNQNNTINEIVCTFHQGKASKRTSPEVFNFMVQYFCQRYKGIRTEEIHEKKEKEGWKITYKQDGIKHTWETNKVRIVLQSYHNTLLEYERNIGNDFNLFGAVNSEIAEKEVYGDWVELRILAK